MFAGSEAKGRKEPPLSTLYQSIRVPQPSTGGLRRGLLSSRLRKQLKMIIRISSKIKEENFGSESQGLSAANPKPGSYEILREGYSVVVQARVEPTASTRATYSSGV